MSRQAIIERERKQRPWVAAAAILPLLLFMAASAVQSAGAVSAELPTETLRSIHENSGSFLVGSVLGGAALILLAVPLAYLFRAAQARSERMLRGLIVLVVLGPVLYGLRAILLALAQLDIADKFVAAEQGVGDIYSLARNLFENSDLLDAATIAQSMGLLAMIFAMVYTCLWAVRTGLLTRFHGTLGMALGASLILPPLGPVVMPALLAWLMYFGVMLLGRAPAGRPPAWDAGEAVPWPAPGQEPVAVAGGNGDVVEGDASEIPGVGESPNAARRERAKKRKRKRRR